MITEDQSAVIDFLSRPSTHGGAPVERIETHSAIVFLAAARAYKLKRAVRFDYLDFSTAALRRTFCDAEVRLNSRTAPHLYRRVLPVTREPDRSLALDGEGSAVDWLVEMNRFPQKALFDKLASTGHLNLALMSPLADAIGAFHTAAERRTDHGGVKGMRWVIDGNALGLVEFGAGWLDQCACCSYDRRRAMRVGQAGRPAGFPAAIGLLYANATAICTCVISSCSTDSRHCSMVWSSTTRSPAPMCITTSHSS